MKLWDFILLTLLLVVIAWSILWIVPLPLPSDPTWTFLGAKLTFLSIILAVGLIQYGYFYEVFKRFYLETAPSWQGWLVSKKTTDEWDEIVTKMEQAGNITQEVKAGREQIQANRQRLKEVEENRKTMISGIEGDLKHFEKTLFLLFGVGFALLVSLVADLIDRIIEGHRAWVALSHGAFISALLLFVVLLIYYAIVVVRQMERLRADAEKYQDIQFH